MADENQLSFRKLSGGDWVYCVEAFVFDDLTRPDPQPRMGLLGLLSQHLMAYAKRGEGTAVVQFRRMVVPGTVLSKHVFRGLRRPMLAHGDKDADKGMLIYTRKPAHNYTWSGPRTKVRQHSAPAGEVFAVIVQPNMIDRSKYPEVDGWINSWAWLDEDRGLSEATLDWVDRYDERLWTRKDE